MVRFGKPPRHGAGCIYEGGTAFLMRKLAYMSALLAAALIVFVIESWIPLPLPVPGAKLGLANAITLFVLFIGRGRGERIGRSEPRTESSELSGRGNELGQGPAGEVARDGSGETRPKIPVFTVGDAFLILVARIILGALFTGRAIAFVYSIAGGLLAFAAMTATRKYVTNRQIWACGAVGAVFHNVGQIGAAVVVTGTPAIAAYLPVLLIVGVATGVVTGLAAQFVITRLTSALT